MSTSGVGSPASTPTSKFQPCPGSSRFLAGDPRAPRRHAAGAVADGPGERGVRGEPPSSPSVEHQIGRAAAAVGRVGDLRAVEDVRRARSGLVVSHQHQPARAAAIVVVVVVVAAVVVAPSVVVIAPVRPAIVTIASIVVIVAMQFVDHGHPVMEARAGDAVRHHVAGPAVRPVAKARRQLDQLQAGRLVGDRSDRPVGAGHHRRAFGAPGHESVERQRPERARSHGAAPKKRPAIAGIQLGHRCSFSECARSRGR